MIVLHSIAFIVLLLFASPQNKKEISFPSGDGVTLTADLYLTHDKSAPFIVLFHQARSSRGEYLEIAPRLNRLGYNCMAVDLRSGYENNGVLNNTVLSAEKAMKPTKYIDTYQDIQASVNYAREYFADGKLVIWGSSYSSALALRFAGDSPDAVDGILAFSPGEYFKNQGKSGTYIADGAVNITKPVFITSAKNEKNSWWNIYEAIPGDIKEYYLPATAGNHGSKALWNQFGDSLRYWDVVEDFLENFK